MIEVDINFAMGKIVEENDKDVVKKIRRAAINLLARREHSTKEIFQKLSIKFPEDKKLFPPIFQELSNDNLQSDIRFAQGYYRWRSAKGFGPDRIARELEQKGVELEVIDNVFASIDIDWIELLNRLYEKKFDSEKPQSLEDKAKMVRFFLYRGFPQKDINLLFKY